MPNHDIIVIGASAGGVEALIKLARALPGKLSAALFVVLHIPSSGSSTLPDILSRAGPLSASHPVNGTRIEQRHIYIAPPDYHMMLKEDHIVIGRGPKEHRNRPAVDPLFRSAAQAYGPRVVGVILTGTLDDGTAGLLAIKRQGGIAIVQNPQEALYPSMPRSAMEQVQVDYCYTIAEIAHILPHLAAKPAPSHENSPASTQLVKGTGGTAMEPDTVNTDEQTGQPSAYSCSECGSVLWEIQDGMLLRFRCRTGHAFSQTSVLAGQAEALEGALRFALKTLEEHASLSQRMVKHARENGRTWLLHAAQQRTHEAERHAANLRIILEVFPTPLDQDQATGPGSETPSSPDQEKEEK